MTDVEDIDLLINLDRAAEQLGIAIPEDLIASAATLIKDGEACKTVSICAIL